MILLMCSMMVSAYLLPPGRTSTPELLVHGAPQLFIGDIEVSLRRLQISVTEQELNRSKIEAGEIMTVTTTIGAQITWAM